MKNKNVRIKLILNKQTIARLDNTQMGSLRAGLLISQICTSGECSVTKVCQGATCLNIETAP